MTRSLSGLLSGGIAIGEDDDSLYNTECRQYGHPKRRLDPTGHCYVCGRRLAWRVDPATGKPYARFLIHEEDPEEERRRRGIRKPVYISDATVERLREVVEDLSDD